MKYKLFVALFIMVMLVANFAYAEEKEQVSIRWFGHACFLLESSKGTKILTDPFNDKVGYSIPKVTPTIITVSHEHPDHNYVEPYKEALKVLRGIDLKSGNWHEVDQKVKDVRVYTVPVYHDEQGGKERGRNSVFVFEMNGLRIAHLGDLGHTLTPEQLKRIGALDILFLPVGGVYTIDSKNAKTVAGQLKPKVIIPMHYKTADLKITLEDESNYLKGENKVRKIKGNSITLTKEELAHKSEEIILLNYK